MLRILIFDSGVGGLSISESLTERLPDAELVLLADNAYFPYGEMDEKLLISRVTDLLVQSADLFMPDCIVVACNTVSTVALEKIRDSLSIPIIGVVPAIKPAALMSESKVIGLLATPATINRPYTAELVNQFAGNCEVISMGSTRLVEMSEQQLRGDVIDEDELALILQPFLIAAHQKNLDVIVLGCTHFPLLTELLRSILPTSINLVDSSAAIARQVEVILQTSVPEKLSASKSAKPSMSLNDCYMTRLENNSNLNAGLKLHNFSPAKLFQLK
jgi:glutamate racemase